MISQLHRLTLATCLAALNFTPIAGKAPTEFLSATAEFTVTGDPSAGLTVEFHLPDGWTPPAPHFAQDPSLFGKGLPLSGERSALTAFSRYILLPPGVDISAEASAGGTPLPPGTVRLGKLTVFRGMRMRLLTVFPIRSDAASDSAEVYRHLQIRLKPIPLPSIALSPSGSPLPSSAVEFLKAAAAAAPIGFRDDPGRDDDLPSRPRGRYLVVAHEEGLPYAIPLLEWKRASGYLVDILSYPTAIANSDDAPRIIKEDIQGRYDDLRAAGEEPFDYILILGDRRGNVGGAPWVLEAPAGNPSMAVANHADYEYGLLEGDDHIGEAAVGRLASGRQALMELAVARILAYERDPYSGDPEWFTRAGTFIQNWEEDADSSKIYIVRWGAAMLAHKGFREVRIQEDMRVDQAGNIIGPVLANWFNERVGLMIGRAENFYWRDNFRGVDNNVVFPIVINEAAHGEFTMQNMFRTGDSNNLKGPAAVISSWGNPLTLHNNATWLSIVRGVLVYDLSIGWARLLAGVLLPQLFNDPDETISSRYQTETDLYGDPGLHVWIGSPRRVQAQLSTPLSPHTRLIEVTVRDEHGDPVPGARVTLYQPGELPEPDQYADWQPHLMVTTLTASDGAAELVPAYDLLESPVMLTVTGQDLRPWIDEIEVATPPLELAVEAAEIDAGDDGVITPGDTVTVTLTAGNTGDSDPAPTAWAVLRSASPYAAAAPETTRFGDIPPRQTARGDRNLAVFILPHCPDSPRLPIDVELHAAGTFWRSRLYLDVQGPRLQFAPDSTSPLPVGRTTFLRAALRNTGRRPAPPLAARLISPGWAVTVLSDQDHFATIPAGAVGTNSGDGFQVESARQCIPGMTAPLKLVLDWGGNLTDTIPCEVPVGEPAPNTPQGPDAYGYVCYDDTDTDWETAPSYAWIEISRMDDYEYPGVRITSFNRRNNDAAEAVPMPFPLMFYGQRYDTVTICTNGFIAVGDQPQLVNYQNYPLHPAMGGAPGIIAPFWDDLVITDSTRAAVFWYYAEDQGAFIVEWYGMRHLSDFNQNLTFQVLIQDPSVHSTPTGDCPILFQYRQIAPVRGPAGDMPFASIGISSPDNTTGLTYYYWRDTTVTSAPIANRRALLFTTLPDRMTAALSAKPIAERWTLVSVYPNPFNHQATIAFSLPKPQRLSVVVFDIQGRKVRQVWEGEFPAGGHRLPLTTAGLPAGIYLVGLHGPQIKAMQKVVLLR